jgi:hypothetical protein
LPVVRATGGSDEYKRLVEEQGAQWCLINFTVDHAGLPLRLAAGGQ